MVIRLIKGRSLPPDVRTIRKRVATPSRPKAGKAISIPPGTDDAFSKATVLKIAIRAGYRCSVPSCRKGTAAPKDDPDDAMILGDAAHIAAKAPGGTRYDKTMTEEQRQSPSSGIWLCPSDHRRIDRDEDHYPVALLRRWKQIREAQARRETEEAAGTLRFESIQIVEELCAWRPAWRRRNAFASIGVHEVKKANWPKLNIKRGAQFADPVFDIVITNTADEAVILSAVGINPLRLWNEMKGMPQAVALIRLAPYSHKVRPLVQDELQMSGLPDPIRIPALESCRFRLQLSGYKKAMPKNESEIAFVAQHADQLIFS